MSSGASASPLDPNEGRFQIFVKFNENSKTFTVSVDPESHTVTDLKRKLLAKLAGTEWSNITLESMAVVFASRIMRDEILLKEYNVSRAERRVPVGSSWCRGSTTTFL